MTAAADQAVIVAIDGPSGVGKTTVAAGVAECLGLPCFDTGAMYRALGWRVLDAGLDPEDRAAVEALAAAIPLGYRLADGRFEVLLAGESVADRIRSPEVSEATSRSAVHPGVRRRMVELQRRWAAETGAVVEGRDIGTKVFPSTPFKFFLEAPQKVRVERRIEQLRRAGRGDLHPGEVHAEVTERDSRDSGRRDSPLAADDTYVRIDTSRGSADEVIDTICARVRAGLAERG